MCNVTYCGKVELKQPKEEWNKEKENIFDG